MSFQRKLFHIFQYQTLYIKSDIQKNKLVEMEMDVKGFDPMDAYRSYDGQTYRAPQSEDQSPQRSKEQSSNSPPIQRVSRGSSDLNNCVRRTVTAIKAMNKNVTNDLKDSPLDNIIKRVWIKFKKTPQRCKQILMVLFNNQPDPAMMAYFGFGEWAKEENYPMFKRAMARLKQLILDNMTHQAIRLYLLDRKRIKPQHQAMFLSYIWKFICGDFRQGTITKVHNRQENLLIRENREKENREDEEMKMYVISSGSQDQVHFPQQQ